MMVCLGGDDNSCGITSATQTAIYACKSGGTVCLIGLSDPEMKLPIFDAAVREVIPRSGVPFPIEPVR
jgi:threonine dehydrogenase-like Zn-dependent dehydrogenase